MSTAEQISALDKFTAKKDVFSFGGAFRILDEEGNLLLYSRQKRFKLKEDIRIYDGIEMNNEVINIQARQILDFSAAYDVYDSATQEKLGGLRRKGWSSIIRDAWEIFDKNDNVIALINEDSGMLAIVRRLFCNLIPQTYHIDHVTGGSLGIIKQIFTFFVHTFNVDLSIDYSKVIDRRLGCAAVILLLAIEGRQQ